MKKIAFLLSLVLVLSCQEKVEKLPTYGMSIVDSPLGPDTIFKPVPAFEFTNQMGDKVSNKTFKGKAFVADFFFTSCPGICPVMTRNMLKVKDVYTSEINFLSHSIDPKRDSVQKLNAYANKIGIKDAEQWHFVTGEKEEISRMADSYMILAYEDSTASGGFEHGGQFVLVDKNQMVRGFYDGLDDESVDKLITDIAILLKE